LQAKDEADMENAGAHPWSIEGNTDSTLLLFNHSTTPQTFTVTVTSAGFDWQKEYKLTSMQTKAIQIRELIDEQVKDDKGKTQPKNAESGETGWLVTNFAKGSGRLLQSDRSAGMARNFSCGYSGLLCGAQTSFYNRFLSDGTIAEFADIIGITCTGGTPNACAGQQTGTAYFNTGWISLSPNVAAISGSNSYHVVNLLGVSGGTSTVNGHFSSAYCSSGGGGQADVQVPTSDPIFSANTNAANTCTTEQGWLLDVNKHIADLNGDLILTPNQTLTETFTIGTPNQLGLTTIQTGTTKTTAAGIVGDTYSVCSTVCPNSSAATDATQHPSDQLPGSSKVYTLNTNSVVYNCNSISVNGKASW
jgi:hypothetical protein